VTRNSVPYAEREVRAVHVAGSVDVTTPVAGWFKIKLGRDTVLRAVRIWNGPPADPITGELLDRSWRWQAMLDDGALVDFDRVWPACARDPIDEQEFNRCVARTIWAREHAADSAYAERGAKIDLLSRSHPLPF
jgi:hypothetical protein